MTPATTLFARICIRPVLSPFFYFPYAGLTILLYRILGYLSLLYKQFISFLVSLDYGSYDPCVPPSATRQRHHTVVRAFQETDAVDLAVLENLTTGRIFLRDCGIDPNEMPRGRTEFVYWFTEYIRPRPRTVLCGNRQDSLCETSFRGYANNDPARFAVTMGVEGTGTPVGGEAIAPTDGGVEGEVAADAAF